MAIWRMARNLISSLSYRYCGGVRNNQVNFGVFSTVGFANAPAFGKLARLLCFFVNSVPLPSAFRQKDLNICVNTSGFQEKVNTNRPELRTTKNFLGSISGEGTLINRDECYCHLTWRQGRMGVGERNLLQKNQKKGLGGL